MDAFDADAIIYAAEPGHPLGRRVIALFESVAHGDSAGVGSVLLVPEVLIRPQHVGARDEVAVLSAMLARLELISVDAVVAHLAATLGAAYGLRAPDAVHLATAVAVGADRFVTSNRRDFPRSIAEIAITYPDDLDDLDDPGPPAQRSQP